MGLALEECVIANEREERERINEQVAEGCEVEENLGEGASELVGGKVAVD